MTGLPVLESIGDDACVFPLFGSAVEVLDTPEHFFQTLLDGVATAQRSITLASLYIGTEGGRERQLVEALAAAAADASRPQLRIRILLDALRSTRPTRGPGGSTTSTAELLAEQVLLAAGQGAGTLAGSDASQPRAAVALFHTPSLRGLLKRVLPPRVREVVGVCHTKLYIFDDDVLLSGANLSNNYFTTRQDRYILMRRVPQLAAFLRDAVQRIAALSYQLQPPGAEATASSAELPSSSWQGSSSQRLLRTWLQRRSPGPPGAFALGPCPAGWDPGHHAWLFNRQFRESMLGLFVPDPARWQSAVHPAVLLAEEADGVAGGGHASWQLPSTQTAAPAGAPLAGMNAHPGGGGAAAAAAGAAGRALGHQLDHEQLGQTAAAPAMPRHQQQQPGGEVPDTWVVPLLQAGFAGLRQEERCTLGLLAHAADLPGCRLQVSTPYLNLGRSYEHQLAQAEAAHLELLTSSPEANGFYGSRGMSGYIPLAYSTLEHRTWQRLTGHGSLDQLQPWRHYLSPRAGRTLSPGWSPTAAAAPASSFAASTGSDRRLLEYGRPGWEFHAKGIWLAPPGEGAPLATLVGSSNYGFRSLHRDLEINFLLVTTNDGLREQLAAEWARLAQHATVVAGVGAHARAAAPLLQPGRRAGLVGRAALRLLRSFL